MTTPPTASVDAPSAPDPAAAEPARGASGPGLVCGDAGGDVASERLAALVDTLRDVSRAVEPRAALREFSRGVTKLYGRGGFISVSTRGLEPGAYRITRLLLDPETENLDVGDPWADPRAMQVHTGGLIGECITRGCPVRHGDLDAAADPVLGDALAPFRSFVATPLYDGGEALNWAFQFRCKADAYSERDLEDILMRANLVGNTVRLLQSQQELTRAQAEIQREVRKVAAIQQALLPSDLPSIEGVSLAVSYETFDQAGGDYYNVHPLGVDGLAEGEHDGRWGLMIADVSGHGVAASVVMAMLQAILMTLPVEIAGRPGEVFNYLNRHLCAKRIEQTFVTACAMSYDPSTRKLRYSRAGHPPALVRRCAHADPARCGPDDVEIIELENNGQLPLGILDTERYGYLEFQLEPGDTLVLFTDGLIEARNADGEFFGTAGIARAMKQCNGEAHCVVGTLVDHLGYWQGGGQSDDDQTVLVMEVLR